MKRFASILQRRESSNSGRNTPAANGDSPEAEIARGVRLFCESGGPNNSGEEVLHLPGIVDAAESSPTAAKEAASVVRKFLSKDNSKRAYVQYNAVMLVRILSDHPGKTFTRNIDSKFIATVKELLKEGRDMSVQQILRETLDNLQISKKDDETIAPLMKMWEDYKSKIAKRAGFNPAVGSVQPGTASGPQFYQPPGQRAPERNHIRRRGLPPPHELASRIEEARTSGKLLMQVAQSTPPQEVLGNDLLKEFAERCQSASRSIQGYINADNPPPDEDTLLTLIETNDQLAAALSRHQRALLQARKMSTQDPPPNAASRGNEASDGAFSNGTGLSIASPHEPPVVGPAGPPPRLGMPQPHSKLENPFDDHNEAPPLATNGEAGVIPQNSLASGQATHPHDDTDDEEETPHEPRQYRF